jgi:hypothetical protein
MRAPTAVALLLVSCAAAAETRQASSKVILTSLTLRRLGHRAWRLRRAMFGKHVGQGCCRSFSTTMSKH